MPDAYKGFEVFLCTAFFCMMSFSFVESSHSDDFRISLAVSIYLMISVGIGMTCYWFSGRLGCGPVGWAGSVGCVMVARHEYQVMSERYLAVCRPHHFRAVQSDSHRSLVYILPCLAAGILVNCSRQCYKGADNNFMSTFCCTARPA